MSEFRRESHLRSLLKGISWRCVATVDTILVALLAIWLLKSEFDFSHALADATKIGLYEFFIKLAATTFTNESGSDFGTAPDRIMLGR